MRKQTIRTRALRTLGACALSAALLLAAGCVEDLGLSPASGAGDRTLGIAMEDGGMTKVSAHDDSGVLSWTEGDAIAVRVVGTGVNEYKSPLSVNVTDKTVTLTLSGDAEINYYSVYPAASSVPANYGNPDLHVIYPDSYTVPSGLAAAQQNLWSPMPMVAANTDASGPKDNLMFYHVGGVLRIKLTKIPTTATSCTVTFVGMDNVAGTYKVEDPGTASAKTTDLIAGTGKGNVVTFNFPANQAARWINVPLPAGDYSSLTAVEIASGGKSVTKAVKWFKMRHGQGRRIEDADLDNPPGPLSELNIGSLEDVTLWKGQEITRTAQACDDKGTIITTGITITWNSSDTNVATVDNTGKVTAVAAGTTTLTATASDGTNTATASFTVHVNEITGLLLDRSSMTLRVGETGTLTATAIYTTYGNPEAPQVNWSVSPAGRVTFAKTSTESGVANTVRGATSGDGTITATIPAGTYGTNDEFVKTCSITVFPRNVIPGAFSISDTEQVYFAPGNLQVNYTGTSGGGHTREWLFSENQWDVFYATQDELASLPDPPAGTTVKLSHFMWGTAGHKNDGGDYGYDANHTSYEPHSFWFSGYGNTWPSTQLSEPNNTWNFSPDLRKYYDWGIHFDDDGVGHDNWYDGTWFTMSISQWTYLFSSRPLATQKRGYASIILDPANGSAINGVVILPDDWQCPVGCNFIPLVNENYATNTPYDINHYYLDTTWPLMEASGAVFLPCGGHRNGYTYYFTNNLRGYYWSSSRSGGNAYFWFFHDEFFRWYDVSGGYGETVRLVHYAN